MEWKKENASFGLEMKKVPTTFIMPLGQPFFDCGTLILETSFAAHLSVKKTPK
jgi:hypothetical protein